MEDDALVRELRARAAARRAAGDVPDDIDVALAEHAARAASWLPAVDEARLAQVRAALDRLRAVDIGEHRVVLESRRPGGRMVKRAVARLVHPQVDAVLTQLREQHAALLDLASALTELGCELADDVEQRLGQQVEDLQARLAEQRRELNARRLPDT